MSDEPGFLAGVLEHMMLGDESLLIAFAASAGINPRSHASAALGGQQDHDMP